MIKILDRLTPSVKVLSFDVFDTLLIRLVPSDQVTRICVKTLCERFHKETFHQLSFPEILDHRIRFKQNMEGQSAFHDSEWTISQWLKKLAHDSSVNAEILKDIGLQSEIYAETLCLKKASDSDTALSIAKERGLIAIATSDTWIDQDLLQKLLEKFGLRFEHIFSSGTIGQSKRKGTIFKTIEKQLGFEPKSFLHVGDDLKADFLLPRLSGWHSVWMPKPENAIQFRKPAVIQKCFKQKKPWRDILKILSVETKNRSSDIFYQMAYDYLAPLLVIFSIVQWRRFREQKIDIAFYIARDARIPLDVYDLLSDILPGSCPRRYIRLSRRAIAIAHPDNYLLNVKHLAGKIGKKKISHWLSNFTVSSELRKNILLKAGVSENADFTHTTRTSLIAACQYFLPEIIQEQNTQKDIIRDYLHQEAGDISLRRVGIVDSGWACTTQDTIRYLLDDTDVISGIYFGVSWQGQEPNLCNLKYGLLRDDFRDCKHHNPLESSAGVIRLWDTILREPVQTVLELKRTQDNHILPIFNKKQIFGESEKQSANSIHCGVFDGAYARIKQTSILVQLSDKYTDIDFEMAATFFAKYISSHPSGNLARALLNLGFDEGAADGLKISIGINGLKKGVAWYPGMLSALDLKSISPILMTASRFIKSKTKKV